MAYAPLVTPADPLTGPERMRYARHLTLAEVGELGQRRLKNARVLVLGAGGLGAPALVYLAAAGVGTIGVVDDDVVELSNLQRQVIHGTDDVGRAKTDSAADAVHRVNPLVRVVKHTERLTADNALALVSAYDLVLDGADNFAARYLVADACALADRPHVWGSVLRFDGQVSVWWAGHGPCLRCVFPAPPPAGSVASCVVAGVIGSVCATVGSVQVTEAVKLILGIGEPLVGRIQVVDTLGQTTGSVRVARDPNCALCGDAPTITTVVGAPGGADAVLDRGTADVVGPARLAALLAATDAPTLIDVREASERAVAAIAGSRHVPLGEITDGSCAGSLPPGRLAVHCASGIRSAAAARILSAAGRDVVDLAGGIEAWVRDGFPVTSGVPSGVPSGAGEASVG